MDILLESFEEQLIAVISDKDTLELRSKMLEFCHILPSIKPPEKAYDLSFGKEELDKLVKKIFGTT